MKVLANRHIGILVHDLDKMIDFYTGLGMTMKNYGSMLERGKFIEGLLSSKGTILKTAKLTIENDELPEKYWFVLELMTLNHEHNKSYSKSVNKAPFSFSDNENGILDIAFTVDDINSVSDYVISHDGGLIGDVMKAAVGYPALHRYLLDPEGNVLHVAENLK
jgi:catechol 2,3-dioxygenase-like lactoylglutathione lyase family enzyme